MGCIEKVAKVDPKLTNANFTLARTPARRIDLDYYCGGAIKIVVSSVSATVYSRR